MNEVQARMTQIQVSEESEVFVAKMQPLLDLKDDYFIRCLTLANQHTCIMNL